jgi:hypothetical protein
VIAMEGINAPYNRNFGMFMKIDFRRQQAVLFHLLCTDTNRTGKKEKGLDAMEMRKSRPNWESHSGPPALSISLYRLSKQY